MTRAVRLITLGWLIVAAYYLPWTYVMGRKILSGTGFTVDRWTIATPFVILVVAPSAAVALWCKRDVIGRSLLVVVAINWLLWAGSRTGMLDHFFWFPTLLKTILFLSVITLAVVPSEWRRSKLEAKIGASGEGRE